MSDVSTNFARKPTHHLFGFAAGKCCRLCRFLRDGSVKTRKSSGPLITSNPAHGLNIKISLHWSIFLHILKMLAFFLRVNTLRSQLQKMPLNPLVIFSECILIHFNGHSKLLNHIKVLFFSWSHITLGLLNLLSSMIGVQTFSFQWLA